MTIANRIYALRNELKMTQKELADKLFVTDKTVSSWEIGRTEPSLDMIIKLSDILKTSIDYLLYGVEDKREMTSRVVRVGLGVIIENEGKILLGHRCMRYKDTGGIYEPDSWTLAGGKQEFGETIFEGAIRAVKEETNLEVSDLEVIGCSDDNQPNKHYVTIHIVAHTFKGNLINNEPDKHSEWKWFSLGELPKNIYTPTKKSIEAYRKFLEK